MGPRALPFGSPLENQLGPSFAHLHSGPPAARSRAFPAPSRAKTDAQLTLETTELARGGKGAVCPDVRIRLVEPVRFRFRTLPNARRVPPARPARNSGLILHSALRRPTRWAARCVSAAVLGCTLTWASSSLADEDRTEAARQQYRRALEAKHEKNYEEARELLLELWEQAHTYDVAGTLGEVEHKL